MPAELAEAASSLAAILAVLATLPAWERLEQLIARRAVEAVGPVDYTRTVDGVLVARPARLADVVELRRPASGATATTELLEAAR